MTTDVFEIPLSPTPQTFSLALGGTTYKVTVRWNVTASAWVLDLAQANGAAILSGVPLVTGVDLLSPYPYLNFGGALYAGNDHEVDAPPGFDDLGVTSHLYWVPA